MPQIRRKRFQDNSSHHKSVLRANTDVTNNLASDEMLDLPTMQQYIINGNIPHTSPAAYDEKYNSAAEEEEESSHESEVKSGQAPIRIITDLADSNPADQVDNAVAEEIDLSADQADNAPAEEIDLSADQTDNAPAEEIDLSADQPDNAVSDSHPVDEDDSPDSIITGTNATFSSQAQQPKLEVFGNGVYLSDRGIEMLQDAFIIWKKNQVNNIILQQARIDAMIRKSRQDRIPIYLKNLRNGQIYLVNRHFIFVIYFNRSIHVFNSLGTNSQWRLKSDIQNTISQYLQPTEFINYDLAVQQNGWACGYFCFWWYISWRFRYKKEFQKRRLQDLSELADIFQKRPIIPVKFLIDVGLACKRTRNGLFVGMYVKTHFDTFNDAQQDPLKITVPFTPFPWYDNSSWFNSTMTTIFSASSDIITFESDGFESTREYIYEIRKSSAYYIVDSYEVEEIDGSMSILVSQSRREFQNVCGINYLGEDMVTNSFDVRNFVDYLMTDITKTTSGFIEWQFKNEQKIVSQPLPPFICVDPDLHSNVDIENAANKSLEPYLMYLDSHSKILEAHEKLHETGQTIGTFILNNVVLVRLHEVKFMTVLVDKGTVIPHDSVKFGSNTLKLCGIVSVVNEEHDTRTEILDHYLKMYRARSRNSESPKPPVNEFVSNIKKGKQWYYYDDKQLTLFPCELNWEFLGKQGHLFVYAQREIFS